jgi:hypothetical protein
MTRDYEKGFWHGSSTALKHLLANVEEHRQGIEDPSAEGPTWDGLVQLLRDTLARVQEQAK